MGNGNCRCDRDDLIAFCQAVFNAYGVPREAALQTAEVLVAADMRGIASHGVARLKRYLHGLGDRQMLPDAPLRVIRETPVSLVCDAGGGLGMPAGIETMERVIAKAEVSGAAFGSLRNSNHFGIAGYYAMLAPKQDMLGIAMSNTAALGVPTFGRDVMFGTNPLAFAAPANREQAFVLDMSTTAVTRGKLEMYDREGLSLPPGWAVDFEGKDANAPGRILHDMFHRRGGGLLPLGGEGDALGGHKGYGLAVMVDILCALLSTSPAGPDISDTKNSSARVSHFFGAIRIDAFLDPAVFREDMDAMLARLRNSRPAEGRERVYYAGLKEAELAAAALRDGVLISRETVRVLETVAAEHCLSCPDFREEC